MYLNAVSSSSLGMVQLPLRHTTYKWGSVKYCGWEEGDAKGGNRSLSMHMQLAYSILCGAQI